MAEKDSLEGDDPAVEPRAADGAGIRIPDAAVSATAPDGPDALQPEPEPAAPVPADEALPGAEEAAVPADPPSPLQENDVAEASVRDEAPPDDANVAIDLAAADTTADAVSEVHSELSYPDSLPADAAADPGEAYWHAQESVTIAPPPAAPLAPAPPREEQPPPAETDVARRRREALRLAKVGLRFAGKVAAGYLALVLFLIVVYRIVDPPGSTLMLFRMLGGTMITRTWVPLEHISPRLVTAVVVAEDSRFCRHWGIDLDAIRDALDSAGDGGVRGASTISMQVTKNLFLWPAKSYVRKVLELPLTLVMELLWPKRRILEIYLNIAEWGPGIFGAEAAAQHHFRKPAARLNEREAALLAASLPNPIHRAAGKPGPQTSRKARTIQTRMAFSRLITSCVRQGST